MSNGARTPKGNGIYTVDLSELDLDAETTRLIEKAIQKAVLMQLADLEVGPRRARSSLNLALRGPEGLGEGALLGMWVTAGDIRDQ